MKTLAYILTLISIATTSIAFAGGDREATQSDAEVEMAASFQAAIFKRPNDIVSVNFTKHPEDILTISIRDNDTGVLVYREVYAKHNQVIKKLDVSRLQAGTYRFTVHASGGSFEKLISLP